MVPYIAEERVIILNFIKSENKYLLVILMDKIPHYKFSVTANSLNTVYLILEN